MTVSHIHGPRTDKTARAHGAAEQIPRVEMIGRSPRRSHAVHLSFFAIQDLVVYEGISFTLEEMTVFAAPVAQEAETRPTALQIGRIVPTLLRVMLHGFVFEVKTNAKLVARDRRASDPTLTFAFHDLAPSHREALRNIIRSYHAGLVASPTDLLDASDDPTFAETDADAPAHAAAQGAFHTWRNRLSLGVSVLVIMGALSFIGAALYDHALYIPAQFATVTAPQLDLRAAEMGQVHSEISEPGTPVTRDARLYAIEARGLDAELVEVNARIEALSAAPDMQVALATQDLVAVDTTDLAHNAVADVTDTAFAPNPEGEDSDPEEDPTPASATASVPQALALLRARLKALDLRKQSLSAFAPCDCTVHWFQENGAWVLPGDVVMTLARTMPSELRIEALVKVAQARDLAEGGRAVVTPVSGGRPFEARIAKITLTPDTQPRVGFPDRLRRADTLASIMLTTTAPLSAADIGQPFEVVMRRAAPFTRHADLPDDVQ